MENDDYDNECCDFFLNEAVGCIAAECDIECCCNFFLNEAVGCIAADCDNECCCDCFLKEAVGWIAVVAIELTWGIINALMGAAYMIRANGIGDGEDPTSDIAWKSFGNLHHQGLIIYIGLHAAEFILAIFLIFGSFKRVRGLCFLWIGVIIPLSLIEIITTILDPFSLNYFHLAILPLRIYFIYIVWSLCSEIKKYPDGTPVRRVRVVNEPQVIHQPLNASAPVIVPAYGYHYGYGGHGYDSTDAALLGLSAGMMLGGAIMDYGYGYDGYYDGNFF